MSSLTVKVNLVLFSKIMNMVMSLDFFLVDHQGYINPLPPSLHQPYHFLILSFLPLLLSSAFLFSSFSSLVGSYLSFLLLYLVKAN